LVWYVRFPTVSFEPVFVQPLSQFWIQTKIKNNEFKLKKHGYIRHPETDKGLNGTFLIFKRRVTGNEV